MPGVWKLEFGGIEPRAVRASGIHRFLSAWFAENVGEHREVKGYSVGNRSDGRGSVQVEVRCVDDRLGELIGSIPAGHPVQFGSTRARIATIAQRPRLIASQSWDAMASYRGTTQWRIELISPVMVSHGHLHQPWPAPAPVLRGLSAKWDRWGPAIEPGYEASLPDGIAVTGAELRTARCDLAPVEVWGAVGALEWTWAKPGFPQGAVVVERLLTLAQFAGIGGYPQHGLGSVTVSGRRAHPARPSAA